ncbi:uncharacterized protein LOC121985718 isoform X1 [Zingiber officinale]|uniref:uncharacterized protein LOC121985718 isoform X1 n=1 Tax=Zingiber officinale TaxID=94328 RepID=UPI001C4D97DD|nr:uncharacterized protein LOC121985718 isoform X1 [Zingiber officinale]
MSVERSFEAWEEVQRHGLDLADRLAQGFNGLLLSHIAPHAFSWPAHNKIEPVISPSAVAADGVSAILDIGNRLGQAGAELGAGINGVVQQFFRKLPVPFWHQEDVRRAAQLRLDLDSSKGRDEASEMRYSGDSATGSSEIGLIAEQFGSRFFLEPLAAAGGVDESEVEERLEFDLSTSRCFKKPQGIVNMTSTYNSRTNGIESSLVARGDLWRVEASRNGSASRNDTSPPILIQLGPLLFVRDTTVLLPVHLSKQHLLWYGYDRKNGLHSLCPALWSKHRRWLMMSTICLYPFTCTFVDLQFPNGQLTYVAGEGLTTSAFLPVLGGLLQAQSQYPGDTKLSFSCKYKTATCITPMVQWPDKSFSLGFEQDLAWKRSGLILRPTIQFSLCPTFGGNNPGLLTELTYSLEERLNLSCGYSLARQPSAFATVALGRSKWNGNAGNVGVVIRAEIPLSSVGRSSFSVQLNSGMEF